MIDPIYLVTGLFATLLLTFKLGRKDKFILLHSILLGSALLFSLFHGLTQTKMSPTLENLLFLWMSVSFLPLLVWFKRTKNMA
ncbi:hypothetical protein [Ammoniphilus sp. YIM 78166]|uniref:hypothetical protein n=1 Tax=Ammoniphilus sp. YIM 78166 TaxID=1644106 RepID=UPI00106F95CF|nr:hypothetical protein [Ammoniphilus sp. YIM 78166]